MNNKTFKFKLITDPSKEMKLLEQAISVDYKGKRNHYVKTLPVISPKHKTVVKSATEFVKDFQVLCDDFSSSVCIEIPLGTLCDLRTSGVLLTNTNKEHVDNIQRNIVKDATWISNLIADMLIGYQPIPSVTLASEINNGEVYFTATDGQQRLFAIIALLNNEFAFYGTNTCLDSLYFKDLPLDVKDALRQRSLVVQISKPEFSDFRKYSFIKLNTTSTSLNSIEMANAMHSSDFSSALKDAVKNPKYIHTVAMVTTSKHNLVEFPSAIPVPLKDRQTEYDRLLFAYANAKTELGAVSSAQRAKRALQIYFLSNMQDKKINTDAILGDIERVSRLMYKLCGPLSTKEYISYVDENGARVFETNSKGMFLHKSSVSNMQYNSLYFICDYLYKNGIRVQKISKKIQAKATEILDNWFTSPEYCCMKGYNNNHVVYRANLAKANEILNLFI